MSFLSDFFSDNTSRSFLAPIIPNIQTGSGAGVSAGFTGGQGLANVLFPSSIAATRNLGLAGTQALLGRLSQNANPLVQARVAPLERALAENQANTQTSFARRGLNGPLLDRTLSGQNFEGQTRIGEQRAIAEADVINAQRRLLQDLSGFSKDELNQVLSELGVGSQALELLAGSRDTASGLSETPSGSSIFANALLGIDKLLSGDSFLGNAAKDLLGLGGSSAGGTIPSGGGLFDLAGSIGSGAVGLANAGIPGIIGGGSPSFVSGIGANGLSGAGILGLDGGTFVSNGAIPGVNTVGGGFQSLNPGTGALRPFTDLPTTFNTLGGSATGNPLFGADLGFEGGGGSFLTPPGGTGFLNPGFGPDLAFEGGGGSLTSVPSGGFPSFSNPFTSPAGFFNPSGSAFLGGGGLSSAVPGVGLVMFLASLSNSRTGPEAAEHANTLFARTPSVASGQQTLKDGGATSTVEATNMFTDLLNAAEKAERLGFGDLVNPDILALLHNSDLVRKVGRSTEGSFDFGFTQGTIVDETGRPRRETLKETSRRNAQDLRR